MEQICLQDKVAIVTGGGNGMGRAICLKYADCGAKIVIADVNMENAKKVEKEVEALGSQAIAVSVDVSDAESVQNLMKTAAETFGGIDILCNNAGIITKKTVEEMDIEKDWNRVMAVNATGVFLCSKAVLPYMKARGGGRIISTASVSGKLGFAEEAAYCASKASVILFTRALATEVAKYNILVNCVCPGNVETDMMRIQIDWDHEKSGVPKEKLKEAWTAGIPLGRLAQPEDIANMYLFLASHLSSYLTGDSLNVTGGMVMI